MTTPYTPINASEIAKEIRHKKTKTKEEQANQEYTFCKHCHSYHAGEKLVENCTDRFWIHVAHHSGDPQEVEYDFLPIHEIAKPVKYCKECHTIVDVALPNEVIERNGGKDLIAKRFELWVVGSFR